MTDIIKMNINMIKSNVLLVKRVHLAATCKTMLNEFQPCAKTFSSVVLSNHKLTLHSAYIVFHSFQATHYDLKPSVHKLLLVISETIWGVASDRFASAD